MVFLEDLRAFEENMSADEKAEVLLEYLKMMKDTYEAHLKNIERKLSEAEGSLEGVSAKITALQTTVAALTERVSTLEKA